MRHLLFSFLFISFLSFLSSFISFAMATTMVPQPVKDTVTFHEIIGEERGLYYPFRIKHRARGASPDTITYYLLKQDSAQPQNFWVYEALNSPVHRGTQRFFSIREPLLVPLSIPAIKEPLQPLRSDGAPSASQRAFIKHAEHTFQQQFIMQDVKYFGTDLAWTTASVHAGSAFPSMTLSASQPLEPKAGVKLVLQPKVDVSYFSVQDASTKQIYAARFFSQDTIQVIPLQQQSVSRGITTFVFKPEDVYFLHAVNFPKTPLSSLPSSTDYSLKGQFSRYFHEEAALHTSRSPAVAEIHPTQARTYRISGTSTLLIAPPLSSYRGKTVAVRQLEFARTAAVYNQALSLTARSEYPTALTQGIPRKKSPEALKHIPLPLQTPTVYVAPLTQTEQAVKLRREFAAIYKEAYPRSTFDAMVSIEELTGRRKDQLVRFRSSENTYAVLDNDGQILETFTTLGEAEDYLLVGLGQELRTRLQKEKVLMRAGEARLHTAGNLDIASSGNVQPATFFETVRLKKVDYVAVETPLDSGFYTMGADIPADDIRSLRKKRFSTAPSKGCSALSVHSSALSAHLGGMIATAGLPCIGGYVASVDDIAALRSEFNGYSARHLQSRGQGIPTFEAQFNGVVEALTDRKADDIIRFTSSDVASSRGTYAIFSADGKQLASFSSRLDAENFLVVQMQADIRSYYQDTFNRDVLLGFGVNRVPSMDAVGGRHFRMNMVESARVVDELIAKEAAKRPPSPFLESLRDTSTVHVGRSRRAGNVLPDQSDGIASTSLSREPNSQETRRNISTQGSSHLRRRDGNQEVLSDLAPAARHGAVRHRGDQAQPYIKPSWPYVKPLTGSNNCGVGLSMHSSVLSASTSGMGLIATGSGVCGGMMHSKQTQQPLQGREGMYMVASSSRDVRGSVEVIQPVVASSSRVQASSSSSAVAPSKASGVKPSSPDQSTSTSIGSSEPSKASPPKALKKRQGLLAGLAGGLVVTAVGAAIGVGISQSAKKKVSGGVVDTPLPPDECVPGFVWDGFECIAEIGTSAIQFESKSSFISQADVGDKTSGVSRLDSPLKLTQMFENKAVGSSSITSSMVTVGYSSVTMLGEHALSVDSLVKKAILSDSSDSTALSIGYRHGYKDGLGTLSRVSYVMEGLDTKETSGAFLGYKRLSFNGLHLDMYSGVSMGYHSMHGYESAGIIGIAMEKSVGMHGMVSVGYQGMRGSTGSVSLGYARGFGKAVDTIGGGNVRVEASYGNTSLFESTNSITLSLSAGYMF